MQRVSTPESRVRARSQSALLRLAMVEIDFANVLLESAAAAGDPELKQRARRVARDAHLTTARLTSQSDLMDEEVQDIELALNRLDFRLELHGA
jgi:hypothetical protein